MSYTILYCVQPLAVHLSMTANNGCGSFRVDEDDEDSDCDFGSTCTPIKRNCDVIFANPPLQYLSLKGQMQFCLTSGNGDDNNCDCIFCGLGPNVYDLFLQFLLIKM